MHKLLYLISAFLLAASLFAAEPFAGTWKLNIAKSKFGGPIKPPKEVTMAIQEQGEQDAATVKGVAGDGSPISTKYTVIRTGGEEKFSEGGPPAGTSEVLAKRKADARSADFTRSLDGKIIETTHVVLSDDGKMFRQIIKGTDVQGKAFEAMQVWDRQ